MSEKETEGLIDQAAPKADPVGGSIAEMLSELVNESAPDQGQTPSRAFALALSLQAALSAREEAQPVAYVGAEELHDIRNGFVTVTATLWATRVDGTYPIYTHPAPDALRVAVEALKPFATHPDFHAGDDWPVTFVNDEERAPGVTAGDFRRARQALAALQAAQGAK